MDERNKKKIYIIIYIVYIVYKVYKNACLFKKYANNFLKYNYLY